MKRFAILCCVLGISFYQLLFKSTIPGKVIMNGVEVYTSGDTYDRVWSTYEQLPDKVQDMFEDNNYRMYIVELIDNDEYIMGQTNFTSRLVLIKLNSPFVERTTFHECGHILDDELAFAFISGSDEFMDIYLEERDEFRVDNNKSYFISTEKEYFASAFAEYMIGPERLKRNTPKTYAFIEQCLK